MAKKTVPAYNVSTSEDYSSFAGSISGSGGKKTVRQAAANVANLASLNLQMLKDLDEKLYLSQAKIEMNLSGNVGVFNAALLSPKFTRRGFKGRNISLAIPPMLDAASKAILEERICSFAKEGSASEVRALISSGAVISMDDAKNLGLIDTVIDLSKKRGSNAGKSAVVSSEGNPAPENTADGK